MPSRPLSFEPLEDRSLLAGITAADIRWEPDALSETNDSAALVAPSTVPTFAVDVALPDGSRMARGLQNGNVEIYDTVTGKVLHTIGGKGSYVAQIEVSPNGTMLAIGTGTPVVRLYDATTYEERGAFYVQGFVYSIVFIGEEVFVSTWEDKAITVYHQRTGEVRTIAGGANQVNSLVGMGEKLFGYDYRGTLKELDPVTGNVLGSVAVPEGSVPKGSLASGMLALGTTDGNVLLFDTALRQQGAYQANIGSIDHLGIDAETGTRIAARSRTALVYLDAGAVQSGGMMTEVGRVSLGYAGRYESGVAMVPDGTAVFTKTEQGVTARKTPWGVPEVREEEVVVEEEVVDSVIAGVTEELQEALQIPQELTDLLTEAIESLDDDTAWSVPEAGDITTRMLPRGAHLNLRSPRGGVIGIQAQISSSEPVVAHVFRGTEEVAEVPVGADGLFRYEDSAEGVTDVLFVTPPCTNLHVTDLSVRVDADLTVPAALLTPMASRTFALANADEPDLPASFANTRFLFDYKAGTSGSGSGEQRMLFERDPTQYTLVRALYNDGSGRMVSAHTIRQAGFDTYGRVNINMVSIQEGYAELIDSNALLLAPGTPGRIFLIMGTQDARFTLQISHGATVDEVMPPSTMTRDTVDMDMLTMSSQWKTEGIFPGVTEIVQGASPTFSRAGDIANVLYSLHNRALAGGALTVDIYVSWYNGEPTRGTLQQSFALTLGGNETRSLSVNVTAPGKPADATAERPSISAIVRLPNGSVVESVKVGGLPRTNKNVSSAEQKRIDTATRRAVDVLMASTDSRIAAARLAIGQSGMETLVKKSSEKAVETVLEQNPQDPTTNKEEGIDAGALAFASAVERVNTAITPAEFMEQYLTSEGKLRYLYLLETELEVSRFGYLVAAADGFTGSFDAMFQGMFGRAQMDLEPLYYKPTITITPDILVKWTAEPLHQLVDSVIPTMADENPWAAIETELRYIIADNVTSAITNKIQDVGTNMQREITMIKREAIWAVTTAYKKVVSIAEAYAEEKVRALADIIIHRLDMMIPLLLAENKSQPIKQAILQKAGIMEYTPGNGSHSGELIVLINGHMQEVVDNPAENGMEYVQQQLEGYEILQFRVGLAYEPLLHNPALIKKLTQEVFFERLEKQGIFLGAPDVTSISLAGYSWGGGTASAFSHALQQRSEFNAIPVKLALIDAVEIGYGGLVQPISIRPPVDQVFNRYETNSDFTVEELIMEDIRIRKGNIWLIPSLIAKIYKIGTEGQPAHGSSLSTTFAGDDQKELSDYDHINIDDNTSIDSTIRINNIPTNIFMIDELAKFLKKPL